MEKVVKYIHILCQNVKYVLLDMLVFFHTQKIEVPMLRHTDLFLGQLSILKWNIFQRQSEGVLID